MTAIKIDESQWPLLIVTPPEHYSDAEWEEHLHAVNRIALRRNQRFVLINDNSNAQVPNHAQRKMSAEMVTKNADDIFGLIAGVAMIHTSALMRGAVTAIGWLLNGTADINVRTFSHIEPAIKWAREQLKRQVRRAA